MNKKAQGIGFVGIVLIAVGILIGLAFFTPVAQNVGTMTQTTGDIRNVTYTMPVAGSSVEITHCGQEILTGIITNATSGATVPATNYTLTTTAGADGYLAAFVQHDGGGYASQTVNVTCSSFEPKGYVNESGTRGIVVLIGIFFALLIAATALPNVRNGVLDFFKKK